MNLERSRRWNLGAGALVCGVALLVYLPALPGAFIWNDSDYVTRPALRSLEGLARIWTQPGATQQYYPLLHSAFWVQHRLWGDHPLGYHLVAVLLHAGCAVLFALVLRRLFDVARAQQPNADFAVNSGDRPERHCRAGSPSMLSNQSVV